MESLDFASLDPKEISGKNPTQLYNLLDGKWVLPGSSIDIVDPLNGETFLKMPNTAVSELSPFVESMNRISKSGLHNPIKNPDRYVLYGNISFKIAQELAKPEVTDFFARCIQRVCPKSYAQSIGEVNICRTFLQNFSGDQVRFLAQGFHVSGDYDGQTSNGYRWPFGPVVIIAPFNFPLEIPVLQLMGALYMGNHVTLKCASTTSMVMEEWVRLMLKCGIPPSDLNLIHCGGRAMGELVKISKVRCVQFTGSAEIAEELAINLHGKIKIEDAGFDWKIMGSDVIDLDYVAWQCDQDAYAHTGQKCSAQSILFAHENWTKAGLFDKMANLTKRRSLDDLTIGPVLSVTTKEMEDHVAKLLKIPGATLLFGGKELIKHTIPKKYGAFEPTAVFVPLKEIVKPEYHPIVTTEIFGPFQVVTEWKTEEDLELVLQCCEMMSQHLTAAVVSNDIRFVRKVLGHTVNGTTYAGIRARTTGAPQNHWFGPCGDPRAAGIGSPHAIRLVWSGHREIIEDFGPIPDGWKLPPPS